jgi:hypothetical protein
VQSVARGSESRFGAAGFEAELDKWVPRMPGLEAVITTAQGNGNQKYAMQTGQLIKETENNIRITLLAPLVPQILVSLPSRSQTTPLSPYSWEWGIPCTQL